MLDNAVARAVVKRFLPACGAVLIGVLAAMAIADPGEVSWVTLGAASLETLLMTAGFGTVVGLAADRLQNEMRLGIRSVAAGILSPITLGAASVFAQGASVASISVLSYAAGGLTGLVLTTATVLRRTHRLEEPDPAVAAAIASLDAELGGANVTPGKLLTHDILGSDLLPPVRIVSVVPRRAARGANAA